jgi:hypothetical protein
LNNTETRDFSRKLSGWFEANAEIPRVRVGERQEIETLINEEALLFAKYLRNEKKNWIPRVGIMDNNCTQKIVFTPHRMQK